MAADISQEDLIHLFGDEDLGEGAYFLEVAGSWLSLRILDYLFRQGPATAGDIARGINMDMQEVRDALESLERVGLVETSTDGTDALLWSPSAANTTIILRDQSGLDINYTMGQSEDQSLPSSSTSESSDPQPKGGILNSLGRRIDDMINRILS